MYSSSHKDLHSSYVTMIAKCLKLVVLPEKQQQLKQAEDHVNETQATLVQTQNAAYLDF